MSNENNDLPNLDDTTSSNRSDSTHETSIDSSSDSPPQINNSQNKNNNQQPLPIPIQSSFTNNEELIYSEIFYNKFPNTYFLSLIQNIIYILVLSFLKIFKFSSPNDCEEIILIILFFYFLLANILFCYEIFMSDNNAKNLKFINIISAVMFYIFTIGNIFIIYLSIGLLKDNWIILLFVLADFIITDIILFIYLTKTRQNYKLGYIFLFTLLTTIFLFGIYFIFIGNIHNSKLYIYFGITVLNIFYELNFILMADRFQKRRYLKPYFGSIHVYYKLSVYSLFLSIGLIILMCLSILPGHSAISCGFNWQFNGVFTYDDDCYCSKSEKKKGSSV